MAAERLRQQFLQNSNFYDQSSLKLESTSKNRYGDIPGVPVGTVFENRKKCSQAGIHVPQFAGISGSHTGAYSVCVSGGYEDDVDCGETFIYTGAGGQENAFQGLSEQVKDQTFDHRDNAALLKSVETKNPVRVVRGRNAGSEYAPAQGYRYDGLYIVEKAYQGEGKSGFMVCKFEFRRLAGQLPLPLRSGGSSS